MFSSVKLYNVNARSYKICWVEPFLQRRKLVEGEFNCDQVFFFEKIAKKRMPEICFPSHQPLLALKTFIWLTCHLGTKDAFYQIPMYSCYFQFLAFLLVKPAGCLTFMNKR